MFLVSEMAAPLSIVLMDIRLGRIASGNTGMVIRGAARIVTLALVFGRTMPKLWPSFEESKSGKCIAWWKKSPRGPRARSFQYEDEVNFLTPSSKDELMNALGNRSRGDLRY